MSYTRSRSRDNRRSRSRSGSRGGRGKTRGVPATVIRINERGFGFLEVEGQDDDIFFHSNDIVDNIDIRQLRVDDRVTVDLEPSVKKKGRYEAVNVVPDDSGVARREKKEARRRYDDRDDRRGRGRYDDRDRRRDYDRRDRRDRDYDRRRY